MTAPTARPLADVQQDALIAVEQEMARRARGRRPWTVTDYLDQNAKEHARFKVAAIARTRLGRTV